MNVRYGCCPSLLWQTCEQLGSQTTMFEWHRSHCSLLVGYWEFGLWISKNCAQPMVYNQLISRNPPRFDSRSCHQFANVRLNLLLIRYPNLWVRCFAQLNSLPVKRAETDVLLETAKPPTQKAKEHREKRWKRVLKFEIEKRVKRVKELRDEVRDEVRDIDEEYLKEST